MSEATEKRERPKEVLVPRELLERLLRGVEWNIDEDDSVPQRLQLDIDNLQRILR